MLRRVWREGGWPGLFVIAAVAVLSGYGIWFTYTTTHS